jgi:hypothetical protein
MTDEDRIRMLLMSVQETPMGMAAMPLTEEDRSRFTPPVFGGPAGPFGAPPTERNAYGRPAHRRGAPPAPRSNPVGIDGEPMAKGRKYNGVPLN